MITFGGSWNIGLMVVCAILLATKAFNGTAGTCIPYIDDPPPHCIGYEAGAIAEGCNIPCGRGGENDGLAELRAIALFGSYFWMLIIAPITILVTMASIFRSVTNIEKQMKNYGVGALRLRTTPAAPTTTNGNSPSQQEEARGFALKLMEMIGKYLCLTADISQMNHIFFPLCCFLCTGDAGCCDDPERQSRTTKSNKMTSQKRAVLHMAVGYAGAWLLAWTPYFVLVVFMIVTKSAPATLSIMVACTGPLQGFFNFLVFMAPKVRTTRTLAMRRGRRSDNNHNQNKQQQHLTWYQAFYKAYMSRGHRLKDSRNIRNNNRTKRRITKTRRIWK
jgi:uncharacterized membrane protein